MPDFLMKGRDRGKKFYHEDLNYPEHDPQSLGVSEAFSHRT